MDSVGSANRQILNTALPLDMVDANRLLQQVKRESGQHIRIFSFPTEVKLALTG